VRQTSYPVQEKGGCIWAYMGEGEPPLIPAYQFLDCPEENRIAFRVIQECNRLQGLEGSTDPAHVSFLHRLSPGPIGGSLPGSDARLFSEDPYPRLGMERTSYGARIHALRKMKDGRNYLRVNNYLYPNGTTPTSAAPPPGPART